MDFSDGSNLGNEITVEIAKTSLVDKSTGGVTCVKLQPAPIAHDLWSVWVLFLYLFIEASWQFFIPYILSGCMEDIIACEAHEVAQTAASAGLVASARIKTIAIERKSFIFQ